MDRLVVASTQLDRCDRAITARQAEIVNFGLYDFEEAEANEVADLTRLLLWDPRGPYNLYPHFRGFRYKPRISGSEEVSDPVNPEKIVNQLASTYTGCRWLLDRWAELRQILEEGLNWQPPDRFRAIRFLGRQPMELLTDERVMMIYLACDAMEPGAPTSLHDMLTETTDDELNLIKEGVRKRGGDRKKPASPEAGKAMLLALIDKATAPLAEKMAAHRAHREFLKAAALDFFAFDDSQNGELMRRYRLAKCWEFNRLLSIYFKVQREVAAADGEWDPCPIGQELESPLGTLTK